MIYLGHWHRWLGLALAAPLVVWIVTGAVFLARPGYEAAYADLSIQRYPLRKQSGPRPRSNWQEIRRVRTVLGPHLLVRTADGWRQLDPDTLGPRDAPDARDLRRLVADAIAGEPRYGRIESVAGTRVHSSTGVIIDVDWTTLSLDQRGRDTRWIAWAYDVHSIEWTGIRTLDQALGGLVLLLLATTTRVGLWLALRPRR